MRAVGLFTHWQNFLMDAKKLSFACRSLKDDRLGQKPKPHETSYFNGVLIDGCDKCRICLIFARLKNGAVGPFVALPHKIFHHNHTDPMLFLFYQWLTGMRTILNP